MCGQQPGMLYEGPWFSHLPGASAFWPTSTQCHEHHRGKSKTAQGQLQASSGVRNRVPGAPYTDGEREVGCPILAKRVLGSTKRQRDGGVCTELPA